MVVFVGIAAVFGVMPKPAAAIAVPFMVIEILFTLGASYFFAAQGIFFRDLTKITEYLFWILFQARVRDVAACTYPRERTGTSCFSTRSRRSSRACERRSFTARVPDIPFARGGRRRPSLGRVLVGGYVYFLQREGSFSKVVMKTAP